MIAEKRKLFISFRQAGRQADKQAGRHAETVQPSDTSCVATIAAQTSSAIRTQYSTTGMQKTYRQVSVLTSVLAALTQQCMQFPSPGSPESGCTKTGPSVFLVAK